MVYRKVGFRTIVSGECSVSALRISVVFRGPFGSWDHYDSFLGFVDTPLICDALQLYDAELSGGLWLISTVYYVLLCQPT